MAEWTTEVLKVLGEFRTKEGVLKSQWRVVQRSNGTTAMRPELEKRSFYMKNGEETCGFCQGLNEYDLKWLKSNWVKVIEALFPAPVEDVPEGKDVPASKDEPAGDEEKVPF